MKIGLSFTVNQKDLAVYRLTDFTAYDRAYGFLRNLPPYVVIPGQRLLGTAEVDLQTSNTCRIYNVLLEKGDFGDAALHALYYEIGRAMFSEGIHNVTAQVSDGDWVEMDSATMMLAFTLRNIVKHS